MASHPSKFDGDLGNAQGLSSFTVGWYAVNQWEDFESVLAGERSYWTMVYELERWRALTAIIEVDRRQVLRPDCGDSVVEVAGLCERLGIPEFPVYVTEFLTLFGKLTGYFGEVLEAHLSLVKQNQRNGFLCVAENIRGLESDFTYEIVDADMLRDNPHVFRFSPQQEIVDMGTFVEFWEEVFVDRPFWW